MRNTYIRIGFAGFGTAILFFFAVQSVYADTIVGQETYYQDTVWDSAGSPYILTKTVTVMPGATLTIKSGVNIISSTTPFGTTGISVSGGKLFIKGKGTGRVRMRGVTGIIVTDGYAEIVNTDMEGGTGMSFTNSRVRIATSTISGTIQAIKSKESIVQVEGSHIKNNSNGIRIVPPQLLLVDARTLSETGGIGNALDGSIPVTAPSFTISNSAIAGNTSLSLGNFSTYRVEASGNWWGSESGPAISGSNRMSGLVSYSPWLVTEPVLDPGAEEPECCSNILFIPGLQGTRLHNQSEKLWEPLRNDNVRQLFLDEQGSSTDATVYAGEVIGKAYGIKSIYGSFLTFLDSLKQNSTINDWGVFGYDWRQPIAEVVAGRTKHATTTESLIETIEALAARSRTGKVTLVAHSNGGLVSRYLVKILTDLGKESLIDSVISVAVPYLGTPEAVVALLHGDGQDIAWGLFQDKGTARALGKNMPSTYSLLPSAEYFTHIFSPTIAFASTTVQGINDGSYPQEIKTYNDQVAFLEDGRGVREDPDTSDTTHPLTANAYLLAAADVLHGIIDPFTWPSTIGRWGIVGWNTITTAGVRYADKESCKRFLFKLLCDTFLTHAPIETLMGDATVVAPSASYKAGTQVSVDLRHVSDTDTKGVSHATILEASTTQALIGKMITHESRVGVFDLPAGTSWGEPEYATEPSFLAISTHSPVELHVYDSKGNHTGPVPASAGFEPGFVSAYENEIPGSSYRTFGNELDPESYVYLPDDESRTYSIVVQGTDLGVATIEVERKGGSHSEKVSFENIPVTPLTTITTSVTSASSAVGLTPLASTTPPLQIDADGDGRTDAVITAGTEYDPLLDIELMRKVARALLDTSARADYIDKRLAKIADDITKGKWPKATSAGEKIIKKIGHIQAGAVSAENTELIIGAIELMIAQFE